MFTSPFFKHIWALALGLQVEVWSQFSTLKAIIRNTQFHMLLKNNPKCFLFYVVYKPSFAQWCCYYQAITHLTLNSLERKKGKEIRVQNNLKLHLIYALFTGTVYLLQNDASQVTLDVYSYIQVCWRSRLCCVCCLIVFSFNLCVFIYIIKFTFYRKYTLKMWKWFSPWSLAQSHLNDKSWLNL